MKSILIPFWLLLLTTISCAQVPGDKPKVNNKDFDKKISKTISFTIPILGVDELKKIQDDVVLLDARRQNEFKVSHIKGAKRIGYKKIEGTELEGIDKDEQIVVYCSIGYRSEKVGEKLKKMGFKNVYNLYGSIFEWVNQGNEVVDKDERVTKKVHTYNKRWSKWIDEGRAEKVW
ncbi:rhodanese-like domain-containing protein [bacterium]|nr:rhodanese-like domain-containing protein [Saprospiraceae bacterium]MDC3253299.1 rhodanese-like domain-containing protein [bacterium]